MYVVFIKDELGIAGIGGIFSTEDKAKDVCRKWNEKFGTTFDGKLAGYIKREIDDENILNVSFADH